MFVFISGSKASQTPDWLEEVNLLISFAFCTHKGNTDDKDDFGNNSTNGHEMKMHVIVMVMLLIIINEES